MLIVKNDEGDRIILNEEVNLYSLDERIKTTNSVKINGKTMTVDEFKKGKIDPKKGHWGRKAMNEMDNDLI